MCTAAFMSLLTACSEYGYPSAIFLENGTPTVAVKACKDLRGIARLAVRRGRYGDDRLPEVWVARLQPGAAPLFEIPLAESQSPGYEVRIREDFDPNASYLIAAVDVTGQEIDGPEFRFSDLVEGRVEAYDAGTQDRRSFSLYSWRFTKEDCPEVRKSEAMEFSSFGLLLLIPVLITASAFALEFRRRHRRTKLQP
jgi:hypothetical protein